MKKLNYLLFSLTVFFLIACSGSDTYRGKWKATDMQGNQLVITFEEHSFTIRSEKGEPKHFEYSQYSVNIENGVEMYGIKIEDGRQYRIQFPIADDETRGLMADGNGNLLYVISRNEYLSYNDIFSLE